MDGLEGSPTGRPMAYLDAILADRHSREAFFVLVEQHGLIVCKNLVIDEEPYRRVRGKRTRGRLSQGEFFHHDGCSSPTRPRIVEIRCPIQDCVRTMGTSVAPFPEVVQTLLQVLPVGLKRTGALAAYSAAAEAGEPLDWEHVQGALNRTIRQLDTTFSRAMLHEAEQLGEAYNAPWTLGESRFIANENPVKTAQHRRDCHPWSSGTPNGHLFKRWPAEELETPAALQTA